MRDVEAVPRIRGWLVARVAAELGRNEAAVPSDVPLSELGFDSLEIMDMIQEIEEAHDVRLYPSVLSQHSTVDALAEHLAAGPGGDGADPRATPALAAASAAAQGAVGGTRNPPAAFILSAPRSGSTLLRAMLAGHPELFAPPELNLVPFGGMRERREALPTSRPDEGLVRALMHLQGIDPRRGAAEVAAMVERDLPVQQVYARLQDLAAGRLLVDKSPVYASLPWAPPRAEELFEEPRYIHLTRHPLAAIDSYARNRFWLVRRDFARVLPPAPDDPAELGEHDWATANATVLDFLATVDPERVFRVRFEDLVAEPRRVMQRLCRFLAIAFDEALLEPNRGDRMLDGLAPGTPALGDPGFLRRREIDASLADGWRHVRRERPLGQRAARVAEQLGYSVATGEQQRMGGVSSSTSSGAVIPGWQPLVELQPEGVGPPLILVHPAGGALFPYYELVAAFGDARPLWALQDPAAAGLREPLETIEEYAGLYVEAVRRAQPSGPYVLGGWSFGGHVAMAMARLLRAGGEDVALVVLLDCEAPVNRRSLSPRQHLRQLRNWIAATVVGMRDFLAYARDGVYMLHAANARRVRRDQSKLGPLQYWRWAWHDAWRRRLAGHVRISRVLEANPELRKLRAPSDSMLAAFAAFNHHLSLLREELPRPYDGDVVLLRARQQVHRSFHTSAGLGWEELVRGRLEVLWVEGNHVTLCQEPHVHTLADLMNDRVAGRLVDAYTSPNKEAAT